jgi:hypothetical protein
LWAKGLSLLSGNVEQEGLPALREAVFFFQHQRHEMGIMKNKFWKQKRAV